MRKLYLFVLVGAAVMLAVSTSVKAQSTATIVKACSSGTFSVFTDCDTGKSVVQSAGPGRNRFAVAADGQSVKILISGGSGTYNVSLTMSDGKTYEVATYPAQSKLVYLTATAKKAGWTSEGLTLRVPSIAATLGYPIKELGGCKDQQDCKKYCENTKNMLACVEYGQGKGMISSAEAERAKKVIPLIAEGKTPGGCKTKETCESYCQGNSAHITECVAFAESAGVLPPEELAQAKKVAQALSSGAKLPGGCSGKASCEKYCEDTTHLDECLNFAEQAQMIPASEIAEARKVAQFLKDGQTPGQCKTKQACQQYCEDDTHFEECIGFAEKAGFVSAEEAATVKKIGGKGPGGCKSKETCMSYCNEPDHAAECADFAISKGLVSAEEAQMIKEGPEKLRQGLSQIPADARPAVESRLSNVIGADKLAKLKAGDTVSLTKDQGDKIGPCFEDAMKNYAQELMQNAIPKDIPTGGPSSGGAPSGMPKLPEGVQVPGGAPAITPSGAPPADFTPTPEICAQFKMAPSCDYVPEGVRAMCEKCK